MWPVAVLVLTDVRIGVFYLVKVSQSMVHFPVLALVGANY